MHNSILCRDKLRLLFFNLHHEPSEHETEIKIAWSCFLECLSLLFFKLGSTLQFAQKGWSCI